MSKNKTIKVIDLFAGAGGFGLGFTLSSNNYEVISSLEVDKWAVDTLKKNSSHNIIHRDIRTFKTRNEIISSSSSNPDIIIGGPPCQGFSIAGLMDPKDPRNSLFKNYVTWVKVFSPKVFVMENVKGILTGKNEKGDKVIDIIIDSFKRIGYKTNVYVLNAANFGVPQNRERVFIIGNRLNLDILPPTSTHYLVGTDKKEDEKKYKYKALTVDAAISDLPFLNAGEGKEESVYTKLYENDYQKIMRHDAKVLYNHVSMAHTKRVVKRYEHILLGDKLQLLPDEFKVRKRSGNGELSTIEFSSNYRHLKPNMVSHTIPASFYSNFIHPYQPRNITSREAARLQSFPDTYVFMGKRTQISSSLLKSLGKSDENHLSQYNQIGNAVPPLLAKAIADHLINYFF